MRSAGRILCFGLPASRCAGGAEDELGGGVAALEDELAGGAAGLVEVARRACGQALRNS